MPERNPFNEMINHIGNKMDAETLVILPTDKKAALNNLRADPTANAAVYPSNQLNHFNLLIKSDKNQIQQIKVEAKYNTKTGATELHAGDKVFSSFQELKEGMMRPQEKKISASTSLIARLMTKASGISLKQASEVDKPVQQNAPKALDAPIRENLERTLLQHRERLETKVNSMVQFDQAMKSAVESLTREYSSKGPGRINVTFDNTQLDKNGARQFSFNIYRNDERIDKRTFSSEELLKNVKPLEPTEQMRGPRR